MTSLRQFNEDKIRCHQRASAYDRMFTSIVEHSKNQLSNFHACLATMEPVAGEAEVDLESMMAPMIIKKEVIDERSSRAGKRLNEASIEACRMWEEDLCQDMHELLGKIISARLDVNLDSWQMYNACSAWVQKYASKRSCQ